MPGVFELSPVTTAALNNLSIENENVDSMIACLL
jgi:hypothetical protein